MTQPEIDQCVMEQLENALCRKWDVIESKHMNRIYFNIGEEEKHSGYVEMDERNLKCGIHRLC